MTIVSPARAGLRTLLWFVAVLAVVLCVGSWALQAALTGTDSGHPVASRARPSRMRAESPVLYSTNSRLIARPRPIGQVALTFDMGSDARWLRSVATILHRRGVSGTFFLTGDGAVDEPELAPQLEAAGHEVGNGGFSPVDLARLSDWQSALHISITAKVLAAETGHSVKLFRPPESLTLLAADATDLRFVADVARRGYEVVLADRVVRAWDSRRSVSELTTDALPPPDASAVVEFPAPVGDPSRALAALVRTIDDLRGRGIELVTASQFGGQSGLSTVPASANDRMAGGIITRLLPGTGAANDAVHALAIVLLALGVLRAVGGVVLARRDRRHDAARTAMRGTETARVSVIIAARNEALVIARTIEALRRSTHPGIELIVVDDGSDDGTADVVESFGPDIVVIRQPATGKPAALNRGVRAARHEFVVSIDADTLVEPTTVTELLRPFEDPEIGAVSGQVLIDRPTGLIGRFQRVEYAIGCNIERRMLNQLGFMTCVSGAVGAYRRHAVLEAGGFSDDTVAEDTDLALELQRWGWKVVYQPSARVFTTAPATVVALWHQRVRWSLGIMQSMWKHRRAIRGRSAGLNVGPRVLAYLFLFSGLALLGPLIDAVAISAILTAQVGHLLAFWAVLTAMTTGLAAAAFSIEDQPLRYALVTPLMTIIYRPVLYLAQVRALQIGSMGLRPRWNRARPVSAGVDEQDIDLRDSPKLCGADFVADFVADFGAVELSPAQQFVLAAEVYER